VIEQRRQIGEARVLGDILERDRTVERDHEREHRQRRAAHARSASEVSPHQQRRCVLIT